MANTSDFENEIKFWLEEIFKKENVRDISVEIEENNEKGDGYMGDIVYVTATGNAHDGSIKTYDLVLKCSKQSQTLRNTTPIKEAFYNEINFYTTVLPIFHRLQEQKQVAIFSSVPKCYGVFTSDDKEVIVLENLKKRGFILWPKKQPLTRKHIELVVTEYGKFHATSVALKEENLAAFEELVKGFGGALKRFFENADLQYLFGTGIDDACRILQGKVDGNVLKKWESFKKDVDYISKNLAENVEGLKVITHGDCWNNNFMFQIGEDRHNGPLKVAMLDWQFPNYTSPILDLSYFIFSCISPQDLENVNDILATYHRSFVNQLRSLNVKQPDLVYPLPQFLEEWNKYSRYGIMMSTIIIKICSSDTKDVSDVGDIVDKGENFTRVFNHEIGDADNFKKRSRAIIEHAVKHNLI